jgi:hypothetical protein
MTVPASGHGLTRGSSVVGGPIKIVLADSPKMGEIAFEQVRTADAYMVATSAPSSGLVTISFNRTAEGKGMPKRSHARTWPNVWKLLLGVFLCFIWSVVAEAFTMSGNDLKDNCDGPAGSPKWTLCYGYVLGTIQAYENHPTHKNVLFCIPPGVDMGRILLVTRNYLSQHPEQLHYAGNSSVIGAIMNAFPCQPKRSVR